jgi:glycosyltransferase involved in cell wall biosynthesis
MKVPRRHPIQPLNTAASTGRRRYCIAAAAVAVVMLLGTAWFLVADADGMRSEAVHTRDVAAAAGVVVDERRPPLPPRSRPAATKRAVSIPSGPARDGAVAGNGQKRPVHLFIAVPLLQATLLNTQDLRHGMFPGSSYYSETANYGGTPANRKAIFKEIVDHWNAAKSYSLCSVTLLVPTSKEPSTAAADATGLEALPELEAALRSTRASGEEEESKLFREVCGASQRTIAALSLVLPTGSLGEWIDAWTTFVGRRAAALPAHAAVIVIDGAMRRPRLDADAWIASLVRTIAEDSASTPKIAGCLVAHGAPPFDSMVATVALEPQLWATRGMPVFRRTRRDERVEDVFGLHNRTQSVFAIAPACVATTAATFATTMSAAHRAGLRWPAVDLAERVLAFAVVSASLSGMREKGQDLFEALKAAVADHKLDDAWQRGDYQQRFKNGHNALGLERESAKRFVERAQRKTWAEPTAREPPDDRDAHDSAACSRPAMKHLSRLHHELGCFYRAGPTLKWCGKEPETAPIEAMAAQLGVNLSETFAADFVDIEALQNALRSLKGSISAAAVLQLMDALLDAQSRTAAAAERAIRRLRVSCDNSVDFLPWNRFVFAARSLGAEMLVPRDSIVFEHAPPGLQQLLEGKRSGASRSWEWAANWNTPANNNKHRFMSIGVDLDDPDAAAAEFAVAGKFKTRGARLHWEVPCCHCCGFIVEWAWIAQGVSQFVPTETLTPPECHCPGQPFEQRDLLWGIYVADSDWLTCRARNVTVALSPSPPPLSLLPITAGALADRPVEIEVQHWDPINGPNIARPKCDKSRRDVTVCRTMYEFGRIPDEWARRINDGNKYYDEVWVPAGYIKDVFVASGVQADRVLVIPEPIDTTRYTPNPDVPTWQLPQHTGGWWHEQAGGKSGADTSRNFKFLSIFKFEPRKGWEALLRAYFEAFKRDDRVSLYVVTHFWLEELPSNAGNVRDAHAIMDRFRRLAPDPNKMPHVVVITHVVSDDDLVMLYRSCDAFVLPSRGEGWGLPIMQAMALAKPTITTRHSGMLEFTTEETVLYVNVSVVPVPPDVKRKYGSPEGATWGEPKMDELKAAMLRVTKMPVAQRDALGAKAREHIVRKYSTEAVGSLIADRVVELEKRVRADRAAAANKRPYV